MTNRFVFTKRFSPRRFLNFCVIAFQHAVTKNSRVVGYPIELVVDPCSTCNLHCPLCPTGQGRKERSTGRMPLGDFKKIIDELGSYLYRVDLHNWGEPLLNNELGKMIEYANSKNIEVRLSSNLNLMNEDKAEELVASGLDSLIVSLDGASQESYAKYRIGGKYDRVLDGVRMVANAKKKFGMKTPRIVWQFIVFKQNEHEIQKVRETYSDLGFDSNELIIARPDMGREIFWSDEMRTENLRHWLPNDETFCSYDRITGKRRKSRVVGKCNFLWVQAAINWNGSVSPCCAVYEEKYDFGNAFDNRFMKIWNNQKYRAARQVVRKRGTVAPRENIVCYCCARNGFI
ncbi:radical SAM protein [Candidatus Bathyarchaeota archaeon]|nr:radical SAM protein [Candidatus Bathyarchaeota archaeon]